MGPGELWLGIDFGTSNTVAVLRRPGGQTETLLFDGSPLLPSAVVAEPDGTVLTGRDAMHSARARPECFEPNPKRRIDDGTVLLGRRELTVGALIAAVLARVVGEARRVAGRDPDAVVLTYPVAWGPRRLEVFARAAHQAGIERPYLVPEPVAAACSFLALPDVSIEAGQSLAIYDLGGGTFDATVVRRTFDHFEVAAAGGIGDVGGLDLDATIVSYLGAAVGARVGEAWSRLEWPETPADRRAARLFWDDVRHAKEILSRASTAYIHVPILDDPTADDDVPLGREQLERLIRPLIARTVATTRTAIREADTPLAGLFLVGGSSRIPLIATMLFRQVQLAPTVVENPELVVAQGCLIAAAGGEALPGGHRPETSEATTAALPAPPPEPPAPSTEPSTAVLPVEPQPPAPTTEVAVPNTVAASKTEVPDQEGAREAKTLAPTSQPPSPRRVAPPVRPGSTPEPARPVVTSQAHVGAHVGASPRPRRGLPTRLRTRRARWIAGAAAVVVAAIVATTVTAVLMNGDSDDSSADSGAASAGSAPRSAGADPTLAAQVPAAIRADGYLTVGTDASYEPMEFLAFGGSTVVGLDVDLFNAVAAELGLGTKYVDVGLDRIAPGITAGTYEVGVSALAISDERKKTLDLVSYFRAGTRWMVTDGNPRGVEADDLCGRKVGVIRGSVQVDDVAGRSTRCVNGGNSAPTVQRFADLAAATSALRSRTIDLVVADSPQVDREVSRLSDLQVVGNIYDDALYGYGVAKNQSGFAPALRAALDVLFQDGTYQQILKSWGAEGGATNPYVNP